MPKESAGAAAQAVDSDTELMKVIRTADAKAVEDYLAGKSKEDALKEITAISEKDNVTTLMVAAEVIVDYLLSFDGLFSLFGAYDFIF